VEPMPKDRNGRTLTAFADELMRLWREWGRRPEVTWQHDWGALCRRGFRSWARDGEGFAQHLVGSVPYLTHGTRVPYSLELLEADLVPLDYDDEGRRIRQGVELNAWGRAIAYHVYKQHPGEFGLLGSRSLGTKRVTADRLTHYAIRDRLHQTRGISLFCSIINRIEDLKDTEDAERRADQARSRQHLKRHRDERGRPADVHVRARHDLGRGIARR
jgi:lambda family phage portal protein